MTVRRVRFGEVMELQREPIGINAGESYRKIGIYSWGRGMIRYEPTAAAEMGSLRYFKFPKGAVVFSNIQAWEQAVAVSTEGESADYVCSNRFLPYVGDPAEVDPRYVLHYMLSEPGHALLLKASPGTQVRNRTLGKQLLENSTIPLPDLPEQRRIATHLDRIALAQVSARASDKRVEDSTASLMQAQFDKLQGEATAPLGDVLELQRRLVEVDAAETYTEIGVRSFGRGLFIKEPLTGAEIGGKRVFRIEPGDLVVSNVFGWEGAVAVANDAHAGKIGSHRFMTWTPTVPVDVTYLSRYLLSARGITSLEDASPGAAGRNRTLSISNFQAIRVPLPGMHVQQTIADRFRRIEQIRAGLARRRTTVDALLPAARNEIFSAMR